MSNATTTMHRVPFVADAFATWKNMRRYYEQVCRGNSEDVAVLQMRAKSDARRAVIAHQRTVVFFT